MGTSDILRLITGLIGAAILCIDFQALAKRKMKEYFGMGWGLFGVLMVAVSVIPGLSGWSEVIPAEGVVAFVLAECTVTGWLLLLTKHVSILMMKNQELAMQVSLLNQENERILYQLEQLTGKKKVNL